MNLVPRTACAVGLLPLFPPGVPRAAATEWRLLLAQSGGNVQPITPGPGFVVEAVIVCALVGLALFAVCRSSRRL